MSKQLIIVVYLTGADRRNAEELISELEPPFESGIKVMQFAVDRDKKTLDDAEDRIVRKGPRSRCVVFFNPSNHPSLNALCERVSRQFPSMVFHYCLQGGRRHRLTRKKFKPALQLIPRLKRPRSIAHHIYQAMSA